MYRAYGNDGLAVDPLTDAQKGLAKGKTLQETLKITDQQLIDYYDYADELYQQKNYADASDIFFFLTQLNPLSQTFWIASANAEWMNNRFESAFAAYQMAITLNPLDPQSYLTLARCCMANGEKEAALDYLNLMESTCEPSEALDDAIAFKNSIETDA